MLCFLLSGYGKAQTPSLYEQPKSATQDYKQTNYLPYYRAITEAERLIGERDYDKALGIYQNSFDSYQTGYLKDYKIATQLAFYLGKTNQGFSLLRAGITHGWEIKGIKKMKFFKTINEQPDWKEVNNQYFTLREEYVKTLRSDIRETVQQMFRKDQRKAFQALFRFTTKAQDRFGKRVFAPHSERQVHQLNKLIEAHGYPGEKLIGNNYWASVILSHHNSMYGDYVKTDTLYPQMRAKLLKAIELGQMSPTEFARVDDWYIVIKSEGKDKGYGYISPVQTDSEQQQADQRRAQIGISRIETAKKLTGIQQQTGLNFYVHKR